MGSSAGPSSMETKPQVLLALLCVSLFLAFYQRGSSESYTC